MPRTFGGIGLFFFLNFHPLPTASIPRNCFLFMFCVCRSGWSVCHMRVPFVFFFNCFGWFLLLFCFPFTPFGLNLVCLQLICFVSFFFIWKPHRHQLSFISFASSSSSNHHQQQHHCVVHWFWFIYWFFRNNFNDRRVSVTVFVAETQTKHFVQLFCRMRPNSMWPHHHYTHLAIAWQCHVPTNKVPTHRHVWPDDV